MSAEDDLFTGSGNLTSLSRSAALDSYHRQGAATTQTNGTQKRRQILRKTEDEYRLTGDPRPDPNGVPIVPHPAKRVKVVNTGIKPFDTINNARSSRPARAQGRPSLSTPQIHPPPITNNYKRVRTDSSDLSDWPFPQKRMRGEKELSKPDVIEIDDSDDHSQVGKPASQSSSIYAKRFGNDMSSAPGGEGVREYRGIEDMVQCRPPSRTNSGARISASCEIDEDKFLGDAKRQRKMRTSASRGNLYPSNGPMVPMNGVQVPISARHRDMSTPERAGNSTRGKEKEAQASENHGDSGGHESPDELQGGTTIRKSVPHSPRSPNSTTSVVRPSTSTRPRSMSPSNIQRAQFTSNSKETRSKGSRKGSRARRNGDMHTFNLISAQYRDMRFDKTTHPDGGTLTVQDSEDTIHFHISESEEHKLPIADIANLVYGSSPSAKVRLCLRLGPPPINLEFVSEKGVSDFVRLLGSHRYAAGVRAHEKPSGWMDRVFKKQNSLDISAQQDSGPKRPSPGTKKTEGEPDTKLTTRKRAKITESLQDESGTTRGSVENPVRNRSRRQPDIVDVDDQDGKSQLELSDHQAKTGRPAGSNASGPSTTQDSDTSRFFLKPRETRSATSRRQATETTSNERRTSPVKIDEPIPKWSTPLLYPRVGKRKAEVEAHDLERLRDHEFLNDNLVGFFLRYLEHHLELTNPDLAKRIYIFNSYFFASLTNTPRGAKGINYQAVSKWTRLVDIFSRDYVIVPINENAHWYVAIICNLPHLKRQLESDELDAPEGEEVKAEAPAAEIGEQTAAQSEPNTSPDDSDKKDDLKKEASSSDGEEKHTRKKIASLKLSDKTEVTSAEVISAGGVESGKEEFPEDSENSSPKATKNPQKEEPKKEEDKEDKPKPAQEPPSSSPPATQKTSTQSKKSRKSTGPNLRKYDLTQPIIITFDSLGCPRSPTTRILRDYLEAEANAKRSMKINKADISGMTAKGIPEQPNYSDCGLYLLAYLEKFAQDPDQFIGKQLQREMNIKVDWPRMESRVLRRQLREFLINLHDEQEGTGGETDVKKNTTADEKHLEILLKPIEKPSEDKPVASARGSPVPDPLKALEESLSKPSENTIEEIAHIRTHKSPVRDPPRVSSRISEKIQSKLRHKTANGPKNIRATPSGLPSTPAKEADYSSIEEIPCTPSEPSQATTVAGDHVSIEPQVPGTPGAEEPANNPPATPSRHVRIIEETPSPKRRSPRNNQSPEKKSPNKSAKRSLLEFWPSKSRDGDEEKEQETRSTFMGSLSKLL